MTSAQARRSRWLRRTRAITSWVAVLAILATLLIAAVAGSASPPKRVATAPYAPRRLQSALVIRAAHAARVHRLHRHRAVAIRTQHPAVKPHTVAPKAATPAPTPTPQPAPTPTPPVAPVVVSGGS
jgi:hypothetical protein